MQTDISNPLGWLFFVFFFQGTRRLQPRGARDSPGGCHWALVLHGAPPPPPGHKWEQMGTRVTQELSQTYLQGRRAHGVERRHFSFVAQITFSLFCYCKKLHMEENIPARCSAGSAGHEKQAGRRRGQSRGKPHPRQCQGREETH